MRLPSPSHRLHLVLATCILITGPGLAAQETETPAKPHYVFAAGRAEGNYMAVAQALATELEQRGREIDVVETRGSYDNAERLRNREADLGLLQSDVAYLEHYNQRPFVALASLYTEPIHILAYRGLDLHHVSEIGLSKAPLVAAVGARGSGSSPHAYAVLDEVRRAQSKLTLLEQSVGDAAMGLRDRTVDVAFVTSAVPTATVRDLADGRIISLLEVDRDIAQSLRRRNPFFVATEIPYEAYKVSDHDIQTLGTRTLLVARQGMPDEEVELVLDALYAIAGKADEDGGLAFLAELSPSRSLGDLAIPLHPGAKRYHDDKLDPLVEWGGLAHRNAIPLVLGVALLLVLTRLSKLAYFVHQFPLIRVLISLVFVWLVGSAAIHHFESDTNSVFRTFGSSSIAILHYLFSGLESKYPYTPWGNVVAITVLSLGVAVVTLFTATLVTMLVEQALNIKTLRSKPTPFLRLSGHTVIAGWSGRTKRIIRQLRSPDLSHKPTVVVIAPRAAATKVKDRRRYRGVWVVEGNRSLSRTLRQADVETAAHALVLSDPETAADPSLISCTHAIDRLAPDLHTVVEAGVGVAVEHLEIGRAKEIVDTEGLARRLVSQCVITPGVAEVFEELLSFGEGSQEIYILPLGQHLDGLSLREVRSRLQECELVLLGCWRSDSDNPELNPCGESPRPLRADADPAHGDKLLILADSAAALDSFRARRKQRRPVMNDTTREQTTDRPTAEPEPRPEARLAATPNRRVTRIGICGWSDESRAVVKQLQDSVIADHQDFQITVIANRSNHRVNEEECTRNVRFVFADPTRRSELDNAGVCNMESLVVLADRGGSDGERSSDHRTLVVCLAAREVNPEVHLVAEVLHSENQEYFERIDGVEIVSVEDLAEKLLAQAVVSPGITQVYLELLTATEDSNEVYVVPVPPRWQGEPFDSIAAELLKNEPPIVALGYRSNPPSGQAVVVLNPQLQRGKRRGVVDWRRYPLGSEDSLVVMAYEEPSW